MWSSLWQQSSITSRGQIHWFRTFRTSEWNGGQMKWMSLAFAASEIFLLRKRLTCLQMSFRRPLNSVFTLQSEISIISHQIIFILKPYILTSWVVTRLCVLFSEDILGETSVDICRFFSIKSPELWKSRAIMFSFMCSSLTPWSSRSARGRYDCFRIFRRSQAWVFDRCSLMFWFWSQ